MSRSTRYPTYTVGGVLAGPPLRCAKRLAAWLSRQREQGLTAGSAARSGNGERQASAQHYNRAVADQRQRQDAGRPATGSGTTAYGVARVLRPSEPTGLALGAFAQVVENHGWAHDTDKIVFAHPISR